MAGSAYMVIQRPGIRIVIEYDAAADLILVRDRVTGAVHGLRPEAFLEGVARREDDDRYRPITEQERAKTRRRERGGT